MKLKHIVSVVAAAVYSAGALNAATLNGELAGQLEAVNINPERLKQLSKDVNQPTTMLQNDGLNVQLNPRKSKFVEEANLHGEHIYIVQLIDAPVAVAAKQPSHPLNEALVKLNSDKPVLFSKGKVVHPEAVNYEKALLNQQATVVTQIEQITGRNEVRETFTKALNGFSMRMTQNEARLISQMPNVARVARSKSYDLLSDAGPELIGADRVWHGEATTAGVEHRGEGQIVGIVDSGINTDHPSFADVGADGYDHTNPWGEGVYVGDCEEDAEIVSCNDKLIGVRSYDVITDAYDDMIPGWPAIGEDYNGHGSHVASTAAGNVLHDVDYMLAGTGDQQDGNVLKEDLFPRLSGVAPHANIISYQVCYPSNNGGYAGCPGEALVAGIEDAIADGVDVINFSIGGADSNVWADPVQLAFLSAREAGISVAAAAGNSGTGACGSECFGYIDNSSPWLTQVAATTHNREVAVDTQVEYAGFNDEANGSEVPAWAETGLSGGAINQQDITGVVVWAKDYADESGATDYNGYCVTPYAEGTFDFFKDGTPIPGADTGETNVIVVCQRHNPDDPNANARFAKVDNVAAGGADGFIMYNRVPGQGTVPESYSLPGVHFTYEQWNGVWPDDGLEDWIDSFSEKGHMITIRETVIERRLDDEKADWLADFSSRGPSYSNEEVLAPAISAPGVSIYAAYSDEHPFVDTPYGMDFSMSSGTSMASPHVAGSMALVRQVNPEWSASEVQSALLMTADNTVQYRRLNQASGDIGLAETYRAGTGRVNVANAVKAGLVMDESADNFLAADPHNGGTPHRLNLPNLVDFSCQPECQWVRIVKATRDGTWQVNVGDVVNWNFDVRNQAAQNGVDIEVIPSSFSLKAGETQSIIVKASIMDTQDVFSNSEVELHSDITFVANDTDIPDSRWPVVFKYDGGELPSNLLINAHEDTGSYQLNGVNMPASEAPFSKVYAPVKGNMRDIMLPVDDDNTFPWRSGGITETTVLEDMLDEATDVSFISVPENAKRLMVEVIDTIASGFEGTSEEGNPLVYVGYDYNGDGIAQSQDEILCVSNHTMIRNFCNINNPESGDYWVVIYNSTSRRDVGVEETFRVSTAVVTDEVSDAIAVTTPSSDGYDTVDLTFSWSQEMEEGDVYYTVAEFGSSEVNSGNFGKIPLKLVRGKDRISMDVAQTKAKTGEQIPLTLSVMPNHTGADRAFTLTTTLPEGMTLHSDNVVKSKTAVDVVMDGQTVTVTGTQPNTADVEASYNVTTNFEDAMCRTPNFGQAEPGGYVDLAEFGIPPSLSGFEDNGFPQYRNGYILPINALYNGYYNRINLYNNTEAVSNGILQIRGNGMVDLTGAPFFFPFHDIMKFNGVPFEVLAPMWRSRSPLNFSNQDLMSVELTGTTGISLASTQTGWAIIEWNGAADYGDLVYDRTTRSYTSTKRDSSFDFEIIVNANTSFAEGDYEIFYAYDNLDFGSNDGRGSIGIKGFKGPTSAFGPLYGLLNEQFAFDNLDEVLHDGLVVCMDYVGPESSQFEVTLFADIARDAAGQSLTVETTANVEGMQETVMTHTIDVASNLTLAPLSDMTTEEETDVEFVVAYADETNTANEVHVSGENVTAVVNGTNVTLTPAADFFGETEVTVTVSDIETPTDSVSQTFMLTVTNQQDAPVVMVSSETVSVDEGGTVTLDASTSFDVDGDSLTFAWSGPGTIDDATAATISVTGLGVGTHEFNVEVSDGTDTSEAIVTVNVSEQREVSVSSRKSGGAMAWLLSAMALVMVMRRRRN